MGLYLIYGLGGFFNNIAVENIVGFKFLLTGNLMLKQNYYLAFAVFVGCNVDLATCAGVLYAHSILAPSTLFVKIVGSIFGVAVGFVVGKEGPMVHMGACIANLLGQGASTKYHLTWTWLRYFKNDRDRRDLITCGAAAGVAAAFRSPVGGVLFALEEAASWSLSLSLILTFDQ
ncbi:putative chloride channel, voltage gated, chloride channel, core [Helianthus anomalus]